MATSSNADLRIVAATLAALGVGVGVYVVASGRTTTIVKDQRVVTTRIKLPPVGPRSEKPKAEPVPSLHKPAPIMTPERTRKKKGKRAERTEGSERPKRASYCEVLRARMARTPERVFSCAEMKAARPCERPGDRGMATAAQLTKGAQCWASGEL